MLEEAGRPARPGSPVSGSVPRPTAARTSPSAIIESCAKSAAAAWESTRSRTAVARPPRGGSKSSPGTPLRMGRRHGRFAREARAARLHHSNIVPVFEVGPQVPKRNILLCDAVRYSRAVARPGAGRTARAPFGHLHLASWKPGQESSAARELAFSLARELRACTGLRRRSKTQRSRNLPWPAFPSDALALGSTARTAHEPTQPVAARLGGLPGIDSDPRHYFHQRRTGCPAGRRGGPGMPTAAG